MKKQPVHVRILCFGVGAIGTYIGGSLALSGQEVIFLERPDVAAQIRTQGLHLVVSGEEKTVHPVQVVSDLKEAVSLGPYDFSILAIKAYDTPAFIQQIRPYASALPPVLCLQNGVENEAALAGVLGKKKVISGTVTSAVGRLGVGAIQLERMRGMGVVGDHPLTKTIIAACQSAGLNARAYFSPEGMKWSKMLTNLLANASSAILEMPPAEIYAHPGLYRLEVMQVSEALRVMSALRIPVMDLPRTPVKALAVGFFGLPPSLSQPLMRKALGSGRGAKMPSFYLDLVSGRGKSEVDYLNGAVVRAGKQLGIPTPVNQKLTEILTGLTDGSIDRSTYAHQPDKLLQILQS